MKKLIMLVVCLMPMMAQSQTELDAEMVGNNYLNQIFLNQSFNQNASIDAVVLSNKEMIETEGEEPLYSQEGYTVKIFPLQF